jgi:hypothetical protein
MEGVANCDLLASCYALSAPGCNSVAGPIEIASRNNFE